MELRGSSIHGFDFEERINIDIRAISQHKHQHTSALTPDINQNDSPARSPSPPPHRRPRHPTPHLPHLPRRLPRQHLRCRQLGLHVPVGRALLLAVRLLRLDRRLLPDDGDLPDAVLQLVERVLRAQARRVNLGRRHVRDHGRGQEWLSVSWKCDCCELLLCCVRVNAIAPW